MLNWLIEQAHNPLFSGLVGASGIGALAYYMREIPQKAKAALVYCFTVRMAVTNDDDSFVWLSQWLARQNYGRRARNLRLSTFYGDASNYGPSVEGSTVKAEWTLTPGVGKHWFFRELRPILVERVADVQAGNSRKIETITISTIGRDADFLRRIMGEAGELRHGRDLTDIWRWKTHWRQVSSRLPRSLDTVFLPVEQRNRIIADAERFFASPGWYAKRGVPYRRGYLFEGEPGTGKTSMALALAGHFRRPLYVLNLGSLGSDDMLIDAMSDVPREGIVLIEDIDAAAAALRRKPSAAFTKISDPKHDCITMSGLLNVIDGAFAPAGRLVIMTTNHPDRLDDALLRAGRVDLRERFGAIGAPQIGEMFRSFYPTASIEPAFEGACNPAEAQAIMLRNANDPARSASELRSRMTG